MALPEVVSSEEWLKARLVGRQARANTVTPATSNSRRPTASAICVSDAEEPA
jgi:hypothetical protein